METVVSVHEAKTHLSRLLERVLAGDEVIVTRSGRRLAKIVPVENAPQQRRVGSAKGVFAVPDDFNEPLSEEILQDFGV